MQKPSLGRIVFFHTVGESPAPAIITRVLSDVCVNITVFRDAAETAQKLCVGFSEPGQEHGRTAYWSWPSRV